MYKIIPTLILALLAGFSSAIDKPTPVTAITNFEPEQYLGQWYEIARIPFYFENGCIAPTTANYALTGDSLSVLNSCRK
ncbi:MAG: apolipoprotein and lipocalin family protein, partial [Pseudomonadota bacterium]|nr:apolipoprotein and lipocalin family protein [Pseudomonadota bacterium]